MTIFAVGQLLEEVRKKYADLPEVSNFLNEIQRDIIENADGFLNPPENPLVALMGILEPHAASGPSLFRRYAVNLFVDHASSKGAPVVYNRLNWHRTIFRQA